MDATKSTSTGTKVRQDYGSEQPSDDLLKIADIAKTLSCSKSLAYGLVASGELPCCHLTAKAIRVRRSDLRAYIASR